MKWPWSNNKEIEELAEHLDTALKIKLGGLVTSNPILIRLTEPIKFIVEHKPYPRPTRIWITFRNQMGEQFQGAPSFIYGRSVMLYPVPLTWLTGDHPDFRGIQVQMELNLEYDETH